MKYGPSIQQYIYIYIYLKVYIECEKGYKL